ncbi:MAG TPA: DUF4199 domain-containing protein [Parasegetibacter sp.]|jgi:hypothetical protein
MENKITSHITKGLVIALILMVFSVIIYLTGNNTASWAQWSSFAIFMGGIVWSCANFANQKEGNITFGNVFAHGFKTSTVVACLMVVFLLLMNAVFPEIKDMAIDQAREELYKQPGLSDDQIDMSLNMVSQYYTVMMIGGTLLGYILLGLVASLIGAGVAKKNPQPAHPF